MNKLMCTNHGELHKSKVDSPPIKLFKFSTVCMILCILLFVQCFDQLSILKLIEQFTSHLRHLCTSGQSVHLSVSNLNDENCSLRHQFGFKTFINVNKQGRIDSDLYSKSWLVHTDSLWFSRPFIGIHWHSQKETNNSVENNRTEHDLRSYKIRASIFCGLKETKLK